MNRALIKAAELRLSESAAWRVLHARFFHEILSPGPGVELGLVWSKYFRWCSDRRLWCAPSVLQHQLVIAGYRLGDDWIHGVKVNAEANGRYSGFRDGDLLDIKAARDFLGVPAGLLQALREFDIGPRWTWLDGKIFYPRASLIEYKADLLAHPADALRAQDQNIRRALAETCEFQHLEWKRMYVRRDNGQLVGHPRLVMDGRRRDRRVSEPELFAAVKTWHKREVGSVPPDIEESIRRFLKRLRHCRRVRPWVKGGKRPYCWTGLWLKAAFGSDEAIRADVLKPFTSRRPLKATQTSQM